jgi:peptidoglycan hydrolase-like protein with peptidoglycan-binding domain
MNRILSVFSLFALTFTIVSAQSVSGDSNGNGIRDDVDSLISSMASSYSLQAPQLSAVAQVARSQQYILSANPQNRAQAIEIAKRDAAATNCASSRLPGTLMEIVYSRIETATFNTVERQAAQDYYISLLGEDDVATPVVVSACEDNYSSNTGNTGSAGNTGGSYGGTVPSGVVPDSAINYPCTVMTTFMEYGSRATQVLTLQKFLSDTGYMEMWPTGYFGRNTEAAVRLWQSRHGVDVRGYVGPNTRASIAAITCKGDTASISRARAGVSTVSSYVAPKTNTSNTTVNTYVQAPVTLVTSNTAQPIINTNVNTYSTAKLSSSSGTFFTRRSPVNTLYVTYKTDTAQPVTICFEKTNDTNCSNPDNFVALASQYRPGAYDAIPNGDRWMLNFYYNATNWANGGKVYIKSTSAIADVYTIRVADSQ